MSKMSRRASAALAITAAVGLGLATAACSSISSSGTSAATATGTTATAAASASATGSAGASGPASTACSNAAIQPDLFAKGQLTVATDSPAYPPWFVNNKPSNGQGYESAVAYAIASNLGFTDAQVKWVTEPFDSSYAPGPKKFDFDVNEISYSPQRAQAVTFSDSYFDVQQAIVALKSSPIVTRHSPSDLQGYVFGDQIGTTSLTFINSQIKPAKTPKVFNTLNDVKQALATKQIAALVADTPTAQFISSSEIPGSVLVGQFPATGEHFGLLLAKGNPLVTCVNQAIASLKSDGTLDSLRKKYLQDFLAVPTIQP
jgi:polar amino acid transport system substrate-binding protein